MKAEEINTVYDAAVYSRDEDADVWCASSKARWTGGQFRWVDTGDLVQIDCFTVERWSASAPCKRTPKRHAEEWAVCEQLDELMIENLNGRYTAIDLVGRFPRFRYFVYRLPNGERYCDDLPRVHWDKRFNMITSVQCADENPVECETLLPVGVMMRVEGE